MKKKSIAFEDALKALGSSTPPTPRILRGLSSLDGDQLAELESSWHSLGANRRAAIIDKLGEMVDNDVELDFSAVFHFTLTDIEESVRLASIEGLWEDESPGLIDALMKLLRSDPSAVVRAAAATSLGRFVYLGEVNKISRYRRDQVYSAIMGALIANPPGSLIYNHALESLAYTTNEQVHQLIKEGYVSGDPGLRVASVVAMGRSNDRQYAPLVYKQLNNVLPIMREEAARACGELGVTEAVSTLGRLLEDPETDVILAAIDALAEIGGDEANKLLEETTHSDDEDIAAAAVEALEEFEFIHGNIKFTTDWIEDFSAEGAGDLDDDEASGDMTAV